MGKKTKEPAAAKSHEKSDGKAEIVTVPVPPYKFEPLMQWLPQIKKSFDAMGIDVDLNVELRTRADTQSQDLKKCRDFMKIFMMNSGINVPTIFAAVLDVKVAVGEEDKGNKAAEKAEKKKEKKKRSKMNKKNQMEKENAQGENPQAAEEAKDMVERQMKYLS